MFIKRISMLLISCVSCFLLLFSLSACAFDGGNQTELEIGWTLDGTECVVMTEGNCTTPELVIPSTYDGTPVAEISGHAFWDCDFLTSITIPNTIKRIGADAFMGCPLERVNYLGTIDEWAQIDFGNIAANPSCYSELYINGQLITEAVLTESVKISPYAFAYNTSLTCISFGEKVKEIASEAFKGCFALTDVAIGDSVENIGDCAFSDCPLLENVAIGHGTTNMGVSTFSSCEKLKKVEFASNKLTSIPQEMFLGCSSLKDIMLVDGIVNIGNGSFAACAALENITIPSSVKKIGDSAFASCASLKKVNYLGTVDEWGQITFEHIMSNPVFYAEDLYINNQLLTCADFSEIKKIMPYAFIGCSSITDITFPNTLVHIGASSFEKCTAITNIVFPENTNSIESQAFAYCTSLKNIAISDGITNIGDEAFAYCPLLGNIIVDENNVAYKSIDGNLYDKSGKRLIQYAIGKTEMEFIVPNSVETIGISAFAKNEKLETVVINESVQYIEDSAFAECKALKEVEIADNVIKIGDSAFCDCEVLTRLVIGRGVKRIGAAALSGCVALTKLLYSGSITEWYLIEQGMNLFLDCSVESVGCLDGDVTL